MPTWDQTDSFRRDLKSLTPQARAAFKRAIAHFVPDLKAGRFRKGLRVKKMAGHDNIWEITWADDGRATFQYGPAITEGEPHIVWRRIGTHDIFKQA
ncbi:MAG: hypothetical protein GEU94_03660 [Micromonosporaceae bacterium]|nr:hypothetical protein [Micromonosporaceae bacterium]